MPQDNGDSEPLHKGTWGAGAADEFGLVWDCDLDCSHPDHLTEDNGDSFTVTLTPEQVEWFRRVPPSGGPIRSLREDGWFFTADLMESITAQVNGRPVVEDSNAET